MNAVLLVVHVVIVQKFLEYIQRFCLPCILRRATLENSTTVAGTITR